MPITAQQIRELRSQLNLLKDIVSLAQKGFDDAIAQNAIYLVDKSDLPSLKDIKRYVLNNELLDYIQYDEDGNFMGASFDYSKITFLEIYTNAAFSYGENRLTLTNGSVIIVDNLFHSFLGVTIVSINEKYTLLQTAKQNLQDFLDSN